jgi:hypothetical protein
LSSQSFGLPILPSDAVRSPKSPVRQAINPPPTFTVLSAEPNADLGCFIAQPLLARLRQLPMIIRVTSYLCSSFRRPAYYCSRTTRMSCMPTTFYAARCTDRKSIILSLRQSSTRLFFLTRVSCDLVTCTCIDVDFLSWIGYSCACFPIAGWHCSYASLGRFSHKPYLHQSLPQLSKKQRRK